MKTHLINLDRSPERLAHMDTILGEAGIPYQRFPAVDGRALTDDQVRAGGPELSRGEIACALSHRAVWKLISDQPDRFATVLEDDIYITPTLAGLLTDTAWIPPDANVIKLETMMKPVYVSRARRTATHGHSLACLYSTHAGTAGYIVDRETARRLLNCRRADRPADAYLFEVPDGAAKGLNVYQLDPAACIQDDVANGHRPYSFLASTIRGERQLLRRSGVGPTERVLREARRAIARIAEWRKARRAAKHAIERKRIPFGTYAP